MLCVKQHMAGVKSYVSFLLPPSYLCRHIYYTLSDSLVQLECDDRKLGLTNGQFDLKKVCAYSFYLNGSLT